MSLTEETSRDLQKLAQVMLAGELDQSPYKDFGTLVRRDSRAFETFEGTVMHGQIEVDGIPFVFFGK